MELLNPIQADEARLGARAGDCTFTAHAVFPPPVTGMTACTESIVSAISNVARVKRFNWSNGARRITPGFRVAKAARALSSPWQLLLGRKSANNVLYMPANAGGAIFYNILAVLAARMRSYRCVIHHHNFRYIDRYDWRINLLSRILGSDNLQIVLCREMERQFRSRYGRSLPLAILPSTVQLLHARFAPRSREGNSWNGAAPFRLGHITNLQIAKGLDLVLEVFRTLRAQGKPVELVLAGPTDTAHEQRMIDDATREFPTALSYRGPVYDQDKLRFFEDIHVSVYPTRNDAQPLVITEAFAFGRPVLTFGRGCIPSLVRPSTGLVVAPDGDFVSPAVNQITSWLERPEDYAVACAAARARYDELVTEAAQSLDSFREWVVCGKDGSFVRRECAGA